MRLITGDETGLLKEVIPELCRPPDESGGPGAGGGIHSGRARPSATSIQAAASSYANYGKDGGPATGGESPASRAVRRLETGDGSQARERGVVSACPVSRRPGDSGDDGEGDGDTGFDFAVLRTNGAVETWSGSRTGIEGERGVTAAVYRKTGGLVDGILSDYDSQGDDDDDQNDDANGNGAKGARGWYARQPIRPIGMVSNYTAPSGGDDGGPGSSASSSCFLAACDSIGNVSLLDANDLGRGVVRRYNAFGIGAEAASSLPAPSSSKNDPNARGNVVLTYTKGRFANTSIATCLALKGDRLAVGGRERGVRVLELETGKLLWKAKNQPPDPQTLLQQPMWTTAALFLNPHTSDSLHSDLLATGTAYRQVQIYDVRQSSTTRRPVLYTPDGLKLLEHRITSLCQLPDATTIAVGDSAGDVNLLDLRMFHSGKAFKKGKSHAEEIGRGRLVGPGGSVRQLAVHPTLPILACVGLDRKMWTWDVTKRKNLDCVYLKQRLNCVLFCDDGSWGECGEGGDGIADYDESRVEDEVEDYVDSDEEGGGEAVSLTNGCEGGATKEDGSESESESEDSDDSGDSSSSTSDESEEDEKPSKRRRR